MRGFRHRVAVEEAREAAVSGVVRLAAESVSLDESAGRVLVGDVTSAVDVPPFRRATMDGYAVRAEDTFGAAELEPVFLAVADILDQSLQGF